MAVETEVVHTGAPTVGEKRVSWGAIFGGTLVALGVWAMLYSLGLALGLSTIDPGESIRGAAIFTGIWSVLAPLVALFAGGWVAGRMSGLIDRTAGVLHGAVLWGLTIMLGIFFITSLVTGVVGTAASLGGQAIGAGAGAAQGAPAALGIDANQMLGPINERLQEQGMPPVTAEQLNAAVQDAASRALAEGRLDGEIFETALAQNTNLSRADVREVAGDLEAQLSAGAGQLQETAATVASSVGRAFWGVFFALALGLVSACLGAAAGVAGVRKREARHGEVRLNRPAEVR
jgi:hypothetical protein